MKNIIMIILATVSLRAASQTIPSANSEEIVISGKLSENMVKRVKEEQFLTVYDDYHFEDPATGLTIPFKLTGNEFTIKFRPKGTVAYFSIGKSALRSMTDCVFLVAKGDSIFLDATSRTEVSFSGRGCEKLNYQQWAGRILDSDIPVFSSDKTWRDIAESFKKRVSLHLAVALDSLHRDRSIGPDSIKNLLRLTTASSFSSEYLLMLETLDSLTDKAYYDYMKREVNFLITQQNGFLVTDPFLLKNCFKYSLYLFQLNEEVARIRTRAFVPPFEIVYPNIKAEYSGLLRDKVLPYCFLTLLKKNPVAVEYLEDAVNLVQDSASKAIINRARTAQSIGAKAYDFNLQTLDGKGITLSDLQGKLIIFDTYYGGCVHCRELSEGLDTVARHFKGRKDIVYISFDGVARDYNTFAKTARSGLYGLPQTIYAWTGGSGERHPLLLYYQYTSYPNLLVIGKDGRVITSNPEKPLDRTSREKFIKLIEKHL